VKSNQFRVSIPADVPPGTYEVRAIGKHGISGSRLFLVSHGLTEVAEKEPNDTPDKAQPVQVNVAINATSDGDGDDFYRFSAQKGQRLVIDCQALRLDSTMRANMTLSYADGRPLVQSKPYYARTDPLLDFVAPADGDYVLGLHDVTYAGGLPYRLVLSTRPHVENVFPMAVRPGEPATLRVLRRNLPGGKPHPGGNVLDRDLYPPAPPPPPPRPLRPARPSPPPTPRPAGAGALPLPLPPPAPRRREARGAPLPARAGEAPRPRHARPRRRPRHPRARGQRQPRDG